MTKPLSDNCVDHYIKVARGERASLCGTTVGLGRFTVLATCSVYQNSFVAEVFDQPNNVWPDSITS